MLKQLRGVGLVAIILILSAVFVLQFGGPQAQGCDPSGTQTAAARVYGQYISPRDYQAAYLLAGGDRYPEQFAEQNRLKEMVLYGLIERNLLAREARRLGYSVSEDDVLQRVAEDGLIHLSMSIEASGRLPAGPQRFDFTDSDGQFSKENLKRFIRYRLRRSVQEFVDAQVLERLANDMRRTIVAAVTVSAEEVWSAYVREKEKATVKYVRYSPLYYRDRIQPTREELEQWMAENQERVDERYEQDKHRYTDLEKQVRARHILIKVDSEADEAAVEEARKRAETILRQARGEADFARLAREHSEDDASARKGGDVGYNARGRMVEEFDEAQFALQPGDISDLVKTRYGFHIIKVEDVREGDVPPEEAKAEIARKLYRQERAQQMASDAARRALAVLEGGKSFEELPPELGGETSEDAPERDALAPQVRETSPFGRGDTSIPGPFDSSPLTQAAFEMSMDEPLADEPIQLGDDWFVYSLVSREEATREDFTEADRARIREGLSNAKRQQVLTAYIRKLLTQAQQDEALFVNDRVLQDDAFAAQ